MQTTVGQMGARTWWGIAAFMSIAMALFSYRYLPRVGPLAPDIVANLFARPWLDLHVGGAATALLLGSFQFIPALRRGGTHRWIGRAYVVSCLVGGIAGLPLALGSTAGPVATAGFGLLAILWLTTNILGWRAALRRDLTVHRRWMIRSWALTLAAVTLRLYLVGAGVSGLPMAEAYRAISFLCWVPNLILAELYLRISRPA